jgi:hypothetical protein
VLVLHTSAPDAGGEPAAALGDRLRAAGAVLAVVTTPAGARYWTTAAQVTGGLAVVAPADRPIRAFDAVADGLRTRYVATFPRPATARAELRWTLDGATTALPVAVPARPAALSAAPAGAAAGTGLPAAAVTGALAAALLAAAGAAVLVRRRHPPRPVVPPGVRVFDIVDDRPKEITPSLFEPRSYRRGEPGD